MRKSLSILLLLIGYTVFGQVPNTVEVNQTTGYNVVHGHAPATTNNLLSLFSNAVPAYFDATYNNDTYAPAGSLKRFRNYTVSAEPNPIVYTGRYVVPLTTTSATITGYIENIESISVIDYGVCYSTNIMPTTSDILIAGSAINTISGIGYYSSTVSSGLVQFTKYYARAYVTTVKGTFYGTVVVHSSDHLTHTLLYDYVTFMPDPTVGQLSLGGVIAYKEYDSEENVAHGLVAATTEYTGSIWGCGDRMYSTGAGYKDGGPNTAAIVARCSTTDVAYWYCTSFVDGGYSDFFLPSLGEVSLMMNTLTGPYALSQGDIAYWSSTEHSTELGAWSEAYYYNLPYGGGYQSKASAARVRPCRYF